MARRFDIRNETDLPGQRRFYSAILRERKRNVALLGGVGGGKTRGLVKAATMVAYSNPPGLPGMVCAPNFTILKRAVRQTMRQYWDEEGIPFVEHVGDKLFHLPETGSDIYLASADNPDSLRGSNLAWVAIDEAAMLEEQAFNIIQARVREPKATHKHVLLATTPRGHNWLYRRFGEPAGKQRLTDAALVNASVRENRFILDADPDFLTNLLESYDPSLAQQEVDGLFVTVGQDRVYYGFDRNIHCTPPDRAMFEVNPYLPLILCADFNVRGSWVVCQEHGGVVRAIDEIPLKGEGSTVEACLEFLRRYEGHISGWDVYADATGGARKTTGYSDKQEIYNHLGVWPYVTNGNGRVIDRVAAFNAKLKNSLGKVSFYVNPEKCPELVKDLEQVRYRPDTRELDKSGDLRRTHASDAVGYYFLYKWPVYRTNSGFRNGRRPAA